MNAVRLAARDADEAAKVRPLLAAAYGPKSAQVRNLDKQAARLESAPGKS
jgi:hypothetical protein